MDFENERSDSGFFIKIFIALIVLTLLIGGYFYFFKKEAPLITQNNQSVPLPKGFERDLENKVSTEFPKGLITEKDVVPIESFSVKNGADLQNTYRYITNLTSDKNYEYFSKFLSTNKWTEISNTKLGSDWFLTYSKQSAILSISYSLNTITKDAIMDITLSQKTNE